MMRQKLLCTLSTFPKAFSEDFQPFRERYLARPEEKPKARRCFKSYVITPIRSSQKTSSRPDSFRENLTEGKEPGTFICSLHPKEEPALSV